jgi:arylsulfatase A-like enzyme
MKTLSVNVLIFLSIIFLISCHGKKQDESTIKPYPNVIVIMTDDQGIGDFGFMGNPYVKTANLDKLASESLNLTNFYVSPVCAPTRASLMTGRYSERTGVYDTYNGGAIMSSDEITIAEILRDHGYRTGIFGKWHLGDNYPYRPIDQGFDEAVVHRGGGMGQPGDVANFFAKDSSYFDPVLFHNGEMKQYVGYCSDVFTDEAMKFIKRNSEDSEQPFFAYLSYNAPHTPLQLPTEYYDMYKDVEFDADAFAVKDRAVESMTENDIEAARRVYGMVTNIDDNIGKLIQLLKERDLDDNTIVVFLTDNGPQQVRYKLGLRKQKSSVFGGGVRVPCLIRYPQKYPARQVLDLQLAHIDLLPSILELCELEQPEHALDGRNFINPIGNEFIERTLFFEWGRGFLIKYQNFAALKGDYKLVGNTEANSELNSFELFNVKSDPNELVSVVEQEPVIALELKNSMDAWYDEIISENNNNRVFPAIIGSNFENPVILNRNDAKGTPVAWGQDGVLGYWDVEIQETGNYDVTLHFIESVKDPGTLHLKLYPQNFIQRNPVVSDQLSFNNIELKRGEFRAGSFLSIKSWKIHFSLVRIGSKTR